VMGEGDVLLVPAKLEEQDFDWLLGATIVEITEVAQLQWRIPVSSGGGFSVNAGAWRLSSTDGVIASSEDNGTYYLGEPIDSSERASSSIDGRRILSARVRERAPDLLLEIEGGFELELLALSNSRECWELKDLEGNVLVVYGSRQCSKSSD
jgi:hypothetical protein